MASNNRKRSANFTTEETLFLIPGEEYHLGHQGNCQTKMSKLPLLPDGTCVTMSLLSELSRGTGKLDGAIVGEGFETLSTYVPTSSHEKRKKSSDRRIPSTYLTRRGNLILYTRADQPPTWESQVLDHYKSMGSLVSQLEESALKKHHMKREMDQRCTPGRPLNPYLGLLKNTLLCSNTVKAISDALELEMSASGRSFPKKGSSSGLEMLPRQLEEMGVNVAEFLQGKGSLSHLIPPEQISDILRDFDVRQRTMDSLSANDQADAIEQDSTMPTPAPPQSPLPEESSVQRNMSRVMSARLRRSSGKRTGSARSAAQNSDMDSAYGTNDSVKQRSASSRGSWVKRSFNEKDGVIRRQVIISADMSTIMSDLNLNETPSPRPNSGLLLKPSSPPPLLNNSGDYRRKLNRRFIFHSGQDRAMYWLPEVSETTYSFSIDDAENLQSAERAETNEAQQESGDVRNNSSEMRPSQIRTAEWINQTSVSRTVSSRTPQSNKDEEPPPSRQSQRSGSDKISMVYQTADESFSELQKLKPHDLEESNSVEALETAKTVSESVFSSTQKDSTMTSSNQQTTDVSGLERGKYEGSQDLMQIQSYRAPDEEKPAEPKPVIEKSRGPQSSRSGASQPISTVSSVSLSEEVVVDFPDRNASNAYGVPWNQSPGDLMGKESEFSVDSIFTETSKQRQSPTGEGTAQIAKPASEPTPRSARPISHTSNTTSGIEANIPSEMTSQLDQHSSLDVGRKSEISPLLETASPVGDRIGTPVLNVPTPSKLRPPTRASSAESISPRPPSSKPTKVPATSPRRQVRTKPSKTPRRAKVSTPAKSKRAVKTAPGSGRSQRDAPAMEELGEEERARIEAERLEIEAAAAAEKQRRLAQAAALQNKIKDAEEVRKEAEREAERKKQEMEAELKALAAEEDAMKMMEEETRQQMMAARKEAREAREKRRREDLERKKEEIRRRKEEDVRRQELASKREREMLQRLGDPNLRQRMAADDATRKAQQQRELEERLAEEERDAAERAAAEERRMEEFERMAEEEAIFRLREDMDDVEERRRDLQYRAKVLDQEKEERRLAALAEEKKIEEERRIQEEINRRKAEEEEQARIKLALEEENLRLMLEKEYEERQMELMKRREHNLELRTDLQHLHHRQQLTRPWVFSYFVHWPRELFERPMGGEPAKPKRFRFPAKSAPKNNDSLPPL